MSPSEARGDLRRRGALEMKPALMLKLELS